LPAFGRSQKQITHTHGLTPESHIKYLDNYASNLIRDWK